MKNYLLYLLEEMSRRDFFRKTLTGTAPVIAAAITTSPTKLINPILDKTKQLGHTIKRQIDGIDDRMAQKSDNVDASRRMFIKQNLNKAGILNKAGFQKGVGIVTSPAGTIAASTLGANIRHDVKRAISNNHEPINNIKNSVKDIDTNIKDYTASDISPSKTSLGNYRFFKRLYKDPKTTLFNQLIA